MMSSSTSSKTNASGSLWKVLVLGALLLALAGTFFGLAVMRRQRPGKDDLLEAVSNARATLLEGDRRALQRASTPDGWRQIHRYYDFHLGGLGYKGTFTDFLKECGEIMQSSDPNNVVRTDLDDQTVVFFFDKTMPIGITIAFRREHDEWRIAFLSLNEIDPTSIFPAATNGSHAKSAN